MERLQKPVNLGFLRAPLLEEPRVFANFLRLFLAMFEKRLLAASFRSKHKHGNKQSLLNELFAIRAAELIPTRTIAIILPAALQLSPKSSAPKFCVTAASSKCPSFPRNPHMPTLSSAENPAPLPFPCIPSSHTWKVRYEIDKVMEEKIWGMERVSARNR
jgi:hypothetical protein